MEIREKFKELLLFRTMSNQYFMSLTDDEKTELETLMGPEEFAKNKTRMIAARPQGRSVR